MTNRNAPDSRNRLKGWTRGERIKALAIEVCVLGAIGMFVFLALGGGLT